MKAGEPSKLSRNLMTVVGGTTAAQAIIFLFSPIITRIYGPEIFGLHGIFLSLISILSPLVALRYPMAIVVAKNADEARQLSILAVIIAFSISGIIGVLLLVFGRPIAELIGAEPLGSLILLLPIALCCVALQDVADYRAIRLGAFRRAALVTIGQTFITNLMRVVGGLLSPMAGILIAITSASYGFQALMLRMSLPKDGADRQRPSGESLWQQAKKYRNCPIYQVPGDMVYAASQAVPVLLLAMLFSPIVAGYYVLARSVMNLPFNIIGSATGNVFYARLASMAEEGLALLPFALKATLSIFGFCAVGALAVVLLLPELFALVFGTSWRVAGEYSQWLALWSVCMIANQPSVRALPVIGKQGLHLLFNLLFLLGGVAGIVVGHWAYESAYASIAIYAVITATLHIAQVATYLYHVRKFDLHRAMMR